MKESQNEIRNLKWDINQYEYIEDFFDNITILGIKDKKGLIKITGEELVPPKYDYIGKFKNGLAIVRIGDEDNGKWGIIDKSGKEIIPTKYDWIGDFHKGVAVVAIINDN